MEASRHWQDGELNGLVEETEVEGAEFSSTNTGENSTPYLSCQVLYIERSKLGIERLLGGLNGVSTSGTSRKKAKSKTPHVKPGVWVIQIRIRN